MALPTELLAQGPTLLLRGSRIGFFNTELLPEGISIFDQSVFVPFGVNTVNITISGTTDGHNGAATILKCTYRGYLCDPYSGTLLNGFQY